MLIGNKYADNKLYRGIKHYNGLPLTMEDLHESMDTLYKKYAYTLNNLIGSGVVLNDPKMILTSNSVQLKEPIALHIDGDIVLVQSSNSSPLYTISESSDRMLYLIGWYQHITTSSTLREYGGVDNSILPNDLLNEEFSMQVSSRYQFRWFIADSDIEGTSLSLPLRDETGAIVSADYYTLDKDIITQGSIAAPAEMPYAISDIYIIPLMSILYDSANSTILSANIVDRKKPTTPDTSQIKFSQQLSRIVITDNTSEFLLPSTMAKGDMYLVLYEGLTLIPEFEYRISWGPTGVGTLKLNVDTQIDEVLTIIHTKLENR